MSKIMQIKCPECGFSREVHQEHIPGGSSFATCPKCATRFRFRAAPEAGPPPAENAPKVGDIWASMDKMRREWEDIDRDERSQSGENAAADEPGKDDEDEARRRDEAHRAYRQAAAQGGTIPFLSASGSVPWEYRGGFLNPLVFLRTVILMATRAPQFFSGINPFSSILPAWVFLLAVRGVQVGMAIMNAKFISSLPDGTRQIISITEVINIPMLIFISVCIITFMHFLGSFIVNYTIQALLGQEAKFRLTFKVMAYANMPVILTVIPGVGHLLGLVASLGLFVMGIRHAYGFNWRRTAISVLPYLIVSVLFMLMILQAALGSAP